jgi:hypothetical protein
VTVDDEYANGLHFDLSFVPWLAFLEPTGLCLEAGRSVSIVLAG